MALYEGEHASYPVTCRGTLHKLGKGALCDALHLCGGGNLLQRFCCLAVHETAVLIRC